MGSIGSNTAEQFLLIFSTGRADVKEILKQQNFCDHIAKETLLNDHTNIDTKDHYL